MTGLIIFCIIVSLPFFALAKIVFDDYNHEKTEDEDEREFFK